MSADLTPRQAEVLAYLEECDDERGCPPTIREIAAHLDISSTNGVCEHLVALESKGFIERVARKARRIRLLRRRRDPSPVLDERAKKPEPETPPSAAMTTIVETTNEPR